MKTLTSWFRALRFFGLIAVFASLVLLYGCGGGDGGSSVSSDMATLKGQFLLEGSTESTTKNANISVLVTGPKSYEALTAGDGKFQIQVELGEYTIQAVKTGYKTVSASQTLSVKDSVYNLSVDYLPSLSPPVVPQ